MKHHIFVLDERRLCLSMRNQIGFNKSLTGINPQISSAVIKTGA